MGQRIPVTLGNIAPLALKPFRPARLALVCEGGGQRGIFTAGVLDEFMCAKFDPFSLSAGAKTIVVSRTVPSQMYYTPQCFKRMERWVGESSLQPLVNLLHHHEASYMAIQKFIDAPPGRLRIIEIYPPKPLNSMALGSRLPALREDYKTGRLCGRYFLATLGHIPRVATPAPLVVPPTVVANDALARPLMDLPQVNDPTFNKEEQA